LEQRLLYSGNMNIRMVRLLLGGAVCAGVFVLVPARVHGQNLFVSDLGGNISEITTSGAQSPFVSGISYPLALAFNSAGDLFVASQGDGHIYEFTPDGTKSTFASPSNGLFLPVALAFDSVGDLFEADGGGWITEIATNGVSSTFASGLNNPSGLAFDSAGNLFVAQQGNGAPPSGVIYKFAPDGTRSTFASGLYYPIGLAFNSSGDLFESDSGTGTIYEFTPSGVQSTFIPPDVGVSGGLAFNSAGDLFVTRYGGGGYGNVYEFTPSGAQSTFASGLSYPIGLAFQPVPELQAVCTNAVFQLNISMPSPYYSTIIQASTNLVNWINIYTNTPPFTFTDSMATNFPCRYYRALLGP
jgi:sugar lactone lactonase YvrE